jgi:hypothetical protein
MEMKYQLGSLTVEAIDTYVRVTIDNINGIEGNKKHAVTKRECPKPVDVAVLLSELQGYYPNNAQLQACSRAALDARNNKTILDL